MSKAYLQRNYNKNLSARKISYPIRRSLFAFQKKQKTKAEVARKNGLEPLAKIVMAQRNDDIEFTASKYLSNTVENEDDALEGARHIISEWINERTDIRASIRSQLARFAIISTKVIGTKR